MDGGSGLTVAVIITAIIGIFTLIINRMCRAVTKPATEAPVLC
jgi:hypothetical protein